jgi:ribonuclease BN (tRNA processing enzyme)
MKVSHITFLGSSSGMPSLTRFCSSLFFQTPKLNFLLDCGEGTSFSLLRNRIDPLLIDSILISHTHVDHLGGLFLLIQMMYLLKRKSPLNVYLPSEAISGVTSFLNTCYLFPEKLDFKLSILPFDHNFKLEDGDLSIEAHPNRHLIANERVLEELKLANRMQSFCLVLKISNKKIVYSGDIYSAEDLDEITEDADLLITECVHPNISELLSLISEKGVKSAILTHVPQEMEARQQEILESARRMGFERLSFAFDGLQVSI